MEKDFMSTIDQSELFTFTEDNGIGILTITRESKLNALNLELLSQLKTFLLKAKEKKLSGLLLTGQGDRAFIAGADIASMREMNAEQGTFFAQLGQEVSVLLEELPFPTLAVVNGFCLGGGFEMALACDYIYSSENAVFGLPEVGLGLIPGFGGTQRLPKLVGPARAKEIIFSGMKFSAKQAEDWGVVMKLYSNPEELREQTKKIFTETVLQNSTLAVSRAKAAVNAGISLSIEDGLNLEKQHFSDIFSSPDKKEGISAFLEKRKPKFT